MINKVKEKLQKGQVILGTFLFTPSPTIMEILGYAGFDFAIIDTEHAPCGALDATTLEDIIRSAEVSGITPLVRIPEQSRIMAQKALDSGALGIVVPAIRTRDDVIQAVRDAKYPPEGHRGSCYLTRATRYSSAFTPEYWSDANRNTIVVPLIENKEAIENIEDILSVEGVDFVFFGSRDYSMSIGQPTVDNPETRNALRNLDNVCRRKGVQLARFLYPPFEESVKRAMDEGARILVVGGDVSLLYYIGREIAKIVQKEA
jgi:4-hydroxy-2-oxoheptanedioate aldolase